MVVSHCSWISDIVLTALFLSTINIQARRQMLMPLLMEKHYSHGF